MDGVDRGGAIRFTSTELTEAPVVGKEEVTADGSWIDGMKSEGHTSETTSSSEELIEIPYTKETATQLKQFVNEGLSNPAKFKSGRERRDVSDVEMLSDEHVKQLNDELAAKKAAEHVAQPAQVAAAQGLFGSPAVTSSVANLLCEGTLALMGPALGAAVVAGLHSGGAQPFTTSNGGDFATAIAIGFVPYATVKAIQACRSASNQCTIL